MTTYVAQPNFTGASEDGMASRAWKNTTARAATAMVLFLAVSMTIIIRAVAGPVSSAYRLVASDTSSAGNETGGQDILQAIGLSKAVPGFIVAVLVLVMVGLVSARKRQVRGAWNLEQYPTDTILTAGIVLEVATPKGRTMQEIGTVHMGGRSAGRHARRLQLPRPSTRTIMRALAVAVGLVLGWKNVQTGAVAHFAQARMADFTTNANNARAFVDSPVGLVVTSVAIMLLLVVALGIILGMDMAGKIDAVAFLKFIVTGTAGEPKNMPTAPMTDNRADLNAAASTPEPQRTNPTPWSLRACSLQEQFPAGGRAARLTAATAFPVR